MSSSTTIAFTYNRIGRRRWIQLATWTTAVACFVWAMVDPRFRDAEGTWTKQLCLPFALAVALLIVGWGLTGRLRRFALWVALGLVGQALALQLIDAGPTLHYQHYVPIPSLANSAPLLLAMLTAQTVCVVAGLKPLLPWIGRWLSVTFRLWQLAAIGLVFALTSATVSRELPVYLAELPFATFIQLVNLGNLVLVARALPDESIIWLRQHVERLLGPDPSDKEREGRALDRFPILVALWVIGLAALANVVVYQKHPHITDEVVYLFHARSIANGSVILPAPPVPAAFEINLVELQNNRWYASTPPGWPAMLAVGALLGIPWLVNPVLAGLNVLLTSVLVTQLYDRRRARMTVLLLGVSPWYVFMAMNFMTHTITLTCAFLGAVAVNRARESSSVVWGVVAGASVGVASLIRPLDGLIIAGLLGLWAIGIGGRRLKLGPLAAFALGTLLFGALVLPYNQQLTGRPTAFPIQAYDDEHFGVNSDAYGFGPHVGMGWPLQPFPSQGHTPLAGVVNTNLNMFSVNIELFGWSTGSLLLAALLIFGGAKRRSDYLMLAVIVATIALYFPYYYSGGPDFGARYWFLVIVPFVVLTVRGIEILRDRVEVRSGGSGVAGTRVIVAIAILSLFTLTTYFPWRVLDKYYHYLDMRPDIVSLAREHGFGRSLVLVRGDSYPDYESAAIYNPLNLHADSPVYAWDRDPQVRAAAVQAYADRPVWIVDGPTLTHVGYRLVIGPLSADQVLARHPGAP